MMQSLEALCEEGEVSSFTSCKCDQKNSSIYPNMVCTHTRSFKKVKTSRNCFAANQDTVPTDASSNKLRFCIQTKLLELYLEESKNDPNNHKTGLKRKSLLLEKLVEKARLNTIILNLYVGIKGYSLTFPTCPNSDICTDDTAEMIESKTLWPYEEEELLRYIDNEELPALLVELLEPHYNFLFYNNCLIVEVRDHRQAYLTCKCDIHHVLLKPTTQSILADVNTMVKKKNDWGLEEKHQLESLLYLANHPKLCLDPKSVISSTSCKVNHNRQLLSTHPLRQAARKYSQVAMTRKKRLILQTHRPGSELYDFRCKARSRSRVIASKTSKKPQEDIKPIPAPVLEDVYLSPPTDGVNIESFKAYPRQSDSSDFLPQVIEEYVLETDMIAKEKDKRRIYHIKLSILQRPSNGEYLGELYLDRDHKKGERNGVSCRFSLGTRDHAKRYIEQFNEIFTERGRKSVKTNYSSKERLSQIPQQVVLSGNLAQQHIVQLQNQPCAPPLVNGTMNSNFSLVQQSQNVQTSLPILQAQLQANNQIKTQQQTNQEMKINALATNLMKSAQKFEAEANAKQQKLASNKSNAVIINLLNSSPASNINSDASAAVVNAINNSPIPQQVQTKVLGRKVTLSNVSNARVLNHNNLIAVNNNRTSLSEISSHLNQNQTITLTSVNSGTINNYSTVPIKQPIVNQRIISSNDSGKSTLSALLVDMPAANRPDIVGPSTNSLLLEKFASTSCASPKATPNTPHSSNPAQFTVKSPRTNQVLSPLSSPPIQNASTINVQSLNFTSLQNLPGLQNVHVQIPVFTQPIQLNVSSTMSLQGHPSLLVSVPVTTGTVTSTTTGQQLSGNISLGSNINVSTPTVMVANTGANNIAQLVTSSDITQQNIRAVRPTAVTLTQAGQPFHLLTPGQRPRLQTNMQTNITARGLQRTPITIKMASPQANNPQITNAQKQAQMQQFHQMCLNQQEKIGRSNVSEPQ